MKFRAISIFCIITVVMVFCGCENNSVNEKEAAEQLVNQIFECLNNRGYLW